MRIPINQHNFRFGSYVRVDHGLGSRNLKRFRVGIELGHILQTLPTRSIQHGNTAAFVSTEGYIDFLFCWIVSHIVGVLSDVHRIQEFERISIVDSEFSICAIRDKELIELAHENHALRIGSACNAVYVATCKRVPNFHLLLPHPSSNTAFPLSSQREL